VRISNNRLNIMIYMSDKYEYRWMDGSIGRDTYLNHISNLASAQVVACAAIGLQ